MQSVCVRTGSSRPAASWSVAIIARPVVPRLRIFPIALEEGALRRRREIESASARDAIR
jgi:hypothetical protein